MQNSSKPYFLVEIVGNLAVATLEKRVSLLCAELGLSLFVWHIKTHTGEFGVSGTASAVEKLVDGLRHEPPLGCDFDYINVYQDTFAQGVRARDFAVCHR